jgi:tRNA(Ile)-lysidine synthase
LVSGEEGADPQNLLRHPENGSEPLRVRNWRPGDRFWPAHSRSPKKVKELLQSRHVSGDTRALWTVIANGQAELVWMQGFGAAKGWLCAPGDVEAIQLACRQ